MMGDEALGLADRKGVQVSEKEREESYAFVLGGMAIQLDFSTSSASLQEVLTDYLTRKKCSG